jgi:hypothetical protein
LPSTAASYPFEERVKAAVSSKLGKNGHTTLAINLKKLNPEKLAKSVIADFRKSFPSLCDRDSKRIPEHYHRRIWEEVLKFLLNKSNLIVDAAPRKARRGFCLHPTLDDRDSSDGRPLLISGGAFESNRRRH